MKCDEVRLQLLDYQEGRLRLEAQSAVRAHLDGCPDCTRADVIERDLTQLLEHRLPQHPASLALKRRLAAQWSEPIVQRGTGRGRGDLRGGAPRLLRAHGIAGVA